MGENALDKDRCNFPGIGDFYDAAIDTEDPIKPVDPGEQPAEPTLPDPPPAVKDPNDLIAMQIYLNELNQYNEEVARLQDAYKEKINDWQDQQEIYKTEIENYQEDAIRV